MVGHWGACAENYSKLSESGWQVRFSDDLEVPVVLASVGVTVPLAEIYAGIEFPPLAPAGDQP